MYSISRRCTVGLDRVDQAFPPIGRIEDLRVVKTILPEDLKALATPRSRFPVSGSGQVVIFFLMCFGIVTLVDMPVSHREAIALSVGVAIALDMTVAVTFSIVITLTLHKAIASIIFIRMICGVVV